jgi:hypothetical protein
LIRLKYRYQQMLTNGPESTANDIRNATNESELRRRNRSRARSRSSMDSIRVIATSPHPRLAQLTHGSFSTKSSGQWPPRSQKRFQVLMP